MASRITMLVKTWEELMASVVRSQMTTPLPLFFFLLLCGVEGIAHAGQLLYH